MCDKIIFFPFLWNSIEIHICVYVCTTFDVTTNEACINDKRSFHTQYECEILQMGITFAHRAHFTFECMPHTHLIEER